MQPTNVRLRATVTPHTAGRPRQKSAEIDIVRGMDSISDWSPRYNFAPTTQMLCIRSTDGERELFPAKWGLIPSWSKDTKSASLCINAKSETVATKPMFRAAFKSRRCLVVASGFYEWQKMDAKTKQPFYITLTSGEPMAMAGLWEWWKAPDDSEVFSCTICTTEANEMMARFHDRMPVILPYAMIDHWLDPDIKDVGNVRNQGEHLIEPLTSAA